MDPKAKQWHVWLKPKLVIKTENQNTQKFALIKNDG